MGSEMMNETKRRHSNTNVNVNKVNLFPLQFNEQNQLFSVCTVFRCGVDYPISFFYKEIMVAFPNAKVSGRLIFNIHFLKLCYPF